MYRKVSLVVVAVVVLSLMVAVPAALADRPVKGGRPDSSLVIYVTSQDLYYDSIVTANPVPQKGPFQQLFVPGPNWHHETDYGPGDPGYVGGRWWVDASGDGEPGEGDAFFVCPLLGPGRENP